MSGSSFDTTSGLLDGRLEVEAAWFGINDDSERAGDKLYLHLEGTAYEGNPDDGYSDEGEEEFIVRLSIGNGWEVVEEGAEVEHGRKNKFNNRTGMGRFLDSIKRLDDAADILSGLGERGEAYQAQTWEGLTIDIEHQNFPFTNDEGEEVDYFVPVVLGIGFPKAKKKGGGKKGKGGSGKASKGSKGKKSKGSADPEKKIRKALIKFGVEGKYEDHEDFVEDALEEFEEVMDFDELHADLMDEDGEIWEAVQEG